MNPKQQNEVAGTSPENTRVPDPKGKAELKEKLSGLKDAGSQ